MTNPNDKIEGRNKTVAAASGRSNPSIKGDTTFPADKSHSDSLLDDAKQTANKAASAASSTLDEARAYAGQRLADAEEQIGEGYERLKDWSDDAYDGGKRMAQDLARRGRRQAAYVGDRTVEFFDAYPLMLGAVGFAGGLILGALLPSTRSEDRYLGRWRDEVEREGRRYGREFTSSARDYTTQQLREARQRAESEMERAVHDGEAGSTESHAAPSTH